MKNNAGQKTPGDISRSESSRATRILRRRPAPLALEPRLIFDAETSRPDASAATDVVRPVEAIKDASHIVPILPLIEERNAPQTPVEPPLPKEVLFIDTSVPDWQSLVSQVKPEIQIFLIDSSRDGFEQIQSTLTGMSDVSAIHILSHGAEGTLILGGKSYTAENISAADSALTAIGRSLSSDGDILLYGCDVGLGDAGASLIGRIASKTGADVAASVDLTGTARVGGNWTLERSTGEIESKSFARSGSEIAYDNWLTSIPLSGKTGWTAIMFGVNRDPVGDSQAGAADTDIVGDANHGSLYTAYETNGTSSTGDDMLVFRLRIDNPTSSTNFGGVAIVGMDVNGDGRVDLFISVDGRNNTQAVRLLDPGTGANLSPSTTTTQPLPTGWLPNNGIYPFSSTNYSVDAVSAANDPHWNGVTDIGGDGKTDLFVSWRVPIADLTTVLAKASPVDRNGVYGPRGATGIAGFNQDTVVRYVSFTQTQPGPINGDLNGVGASYDKNATFASLGAFTDPMSPSTPVASGPVLSITSPNGGLVLNDSQDNAVSISGTSTYLANKALTLRVTDGVTTVTGTTSTASDGTWTVTGLDLSALNNGTLSVTATVDPDANPGTTDDVVASANLVHDKTAPAISIDQLGTAISGTPTFTGTSDLPDGSLITLTIDPDNNSLTTNLVYQVVVSAGVWSLNTAAVIPISGTMPATGLTGYTKVTASATDAAGNTATAVALDRPTVTSLSTNSTTPILTGTWMNNAGDVLTVTVNGATYTLAPSGNTWSLNLATATPSSGSLSALVAGNSYEVVARVTRAGNNVTDTTSAEVTITNTPVIAIGINGGASVNGTNTSPTITGTSQNAGGFVIVRLDPNNDGDLSDAVTYSVTPDGSGNWTLDTSVATPISGTKPTAGFIGAVGVRATDSTGAQASAQLLTISTPSIAIGSITSTATGNASAAINNSGGGAAWLNMTEDNAVTISGTATNGFTVNLVVSDANGNSVSSSGLTVSSGAWSASGLDLSALDNTTLTVRATLVGTAISATNTSVVHDATAPRIFITTPSIIPKNQATIYGGSELANTQLTITIRNSTDTTTQWTGTVTTDANGNWSVTTPNGTNLVSGNTGTVIIKVVPTSTATDAAGNIAQQASISGQTVQQGAANATDTITISSVTADNIIAGNEISGGISITGTTTVTAAAIGAFTVSVTDGTTTVNATIVSNVSGAWTSTLTKAQIQSLKNGPLTVTATVTNASAITVSDVELPTLDLDTPVLTISDNVAGTAAGPVTFTFTFTEAVTGFDVSDITVVNGTKGTLSGSGTTYTLVVTPTADSSGNIVVSVNSGLATGSTTGRGNASASNTQPFNTTSAASAPTITIDTSGLATNPTPTITGTTSLAAGAPIVIAIDTNNDGVTDLTYSSTVQSGGTWTLDTSTATPTSGTIPANGFDAFAKVVATATNAYGIGASATGLNKPTVASQRTNDSTPTITGTWTQIAGDTLSVVVNGVTYSVANGNLTVTATTWSLTPSVALADNTYEVVATVTRAGGGTAVDLTANEVLVDTLATVTISGGASVDTTGNAFPTLSGTTTGIPAGTVLTLSLDIDNDGSTEAVFKTTVAANGSWSVDTSTATTTSGSFPSAGLNGPVKVTATATDPAGNAASDIQVLTVDVTGPTIALTINGKTSDSTPVITGTTDLSAGSTITVEIDPNNDGNWSDKQTYTATVQTGGSWSVEATTPVSGTIGVRATGADPLGNSSTTATKPLEIVVNAPTISVTEPIVSIGVDNTADSTEDDAVVLAGTTSNVAIGSVVNVTVTDGTLTISDAAVVQADGSWSLASLNLSAMANGAISVTAVVVDSDGSAYTDAAAFTHDKTATVAIDSISQDTGLLADFITKDNTVTITGTAGASASVTVVVKDSNANTVATFNVTADANGSWTTSATGALAVGNYQIFASVGGTTAIKAMQIVDATAPTLISSTPGDDAIGVAVGGNITLTFSKDITLGSGFVSLYKADGTLVENFDVNTGIGDAGGSISASGMTGLVLDPFAILASGTGYYLKIDSTAVIDAAGNNYAGIASSTALNFTTVVIDTTPPTITGPSGNAGDAASVKTINENTTAVATLTANESVTWSLVGGVDQSKFTIDASTGALSFIAAPDFELPSDSDTNNTYLVQVRATDSSGNHSEQTITVTIADVVEITPDTTPPSITGPSGNAGDVTSAKTSNENTTAVTTLTANESVTWSLVGGVDQAKFTIDASTGALSFIAAPDFELPSDSDTNNTYLVQVRATDSSGNHSEQTITVTIADVVEVTPDTTPPSITGPSGNAGDATSAKTINENTTAIATLTANESVTWSLVGGVDQAKFTIDASTGALSFIAAPDYELPSDSDANNTYLVQVRATDSSGNHSEQTITVTIADVVEITPDTTPPSITGPSGNAGDATSVKTINENTTAVATLTANETVTWSLVGGVDQSKFTIDASTGALSFTAAPDYELPSDSDANNTYLVQVRATDSSGNHSEQTITVTIADVVEVTPDTTPPTITGPSGNAGDATSVKTINENTTAVATLAANETVTWSLVGGVDQSKFTINASTGALSFIAAPDYELPSDSDANNAYLVQVRATDSSGNHSEQTITVTIADVVEVTPDTTPPSITGPSGNAGDATSGKTINENTTAVTTLTANESVTWSLVGGTDQAKFTINASTGALSFIAAPDYELPSDSDANNTYLVQVRATDSSGNHSEQTITVTIADVVEITPDTTPPSITGPSGNAGDATSGKTINENTTTVTTLTANESVTWSLVGGTDQTKFTINASTGALSFIAAPDYELPSDSDTNNTYLVQVRATDSSGNHSEQTITVTIADVIEVTPDTTPPSITGPSGNAGDATSVKTINENTTAVATLTANENVTWSLVGGVDQAKFTINASTGALSFIAAPDYELPSDSDANNTYLVQVRATDSSGNHSEQTITVTIADVIEVTPDTTPPSITGPSGNPGDTTSAKTINENSTAVATLTANENVTWSLVGGVDQVKFTINASTGALSFIAAPDFELPSDSDANNTYLVQVRATDSGGNHSEQTITVTIANVVEGPVAPPLTSTTVEVGSVLSPLVIPLFPNGDGAKLSYSATLSDGSALPSWLTFDPVTRTFGGTPPAGTAAADLSIKVTAANGDASASGSFTLKVVVPAAPVAGNDAANATEASGIGHVTPGHNPTGNVLANDLGSGVTVTSVQLGSALNSSATSLSGGVATLVGDFGTLTIHSDGSYDYVVDNSKAAVIALNTGDTLIESFAYRVTDKAGQTSTAILAVSVSGVTDQLPPVIQPQPPAIPVSTIVATPSALPPEVTVVATGVIEVVTITSTTLPAPDRESAGHRETWSTPAPEETTRTVNSSYPMAVIPSAESRLVVYRGIPDQFNEAEGVVRFVIPTDAFARSNEESEVIFSATLVDGSPLPSWLVFDRANGAFSGVAPRGFSGELKIKVLARNAQGQQAEAVFRFFVGKTTRSSQNKNGLSAQMRGMAYLNTPIHALDIAAK